MKNQALNDIKNYAAKRLRQEFGYCGVAEGDNMAMLNSGGDNEKITIHIKLDREDEAA